MKQCLIWVILFCFLKMTDCTGQSPSPYFNEKDSIHISGKIIDFKAAQGDDFISFVTFGIDGKSKKESFQVSPDGSFDVAVYQSFAGDVSVSYRTAFASVFARPGSHIQIEIQNGAAEARKQGKDVFLAKGELSDVNNLIFEFRSEFRDHEFVQPVDLGNKEQGDSAFAVNRRLKLAEELAFLEAFMSNRKIQNIEFENWQKNQLVYTAGKEILMFPFLGKMNKTISEHQLQQLIGSISINNASALHNSDYYNFLNTLVTSHQIIVNINPAYEEQKKKNGNNAIPVNLAQFDKLSSGITREIIYLDLYLSHFGHASRKGIVGSFSEKFESTIADPYLKSELNKLADSMGEGFKPYHIISRIRALKANAELKTRLISTFEKAAGSNVFIDFWGDWCGPCMIEMPAYPELIRKFEGKPIKFIFFSVQTRDKSVERIKEKYQIKADFINLNNDEVAMMNNVFEFHAYPAHFVVDSQGYAVANQTKRAEEIEHLISR